MGKEGGRGKLEVISDVLVILVCLVFLVAFIVGGFLVLRYGPQVYKIASGAYGTISGLTGTGGGSDTKQFISTGTNTDLCSDLLAAQNAFTSGDSATASKKLDSAEATAKSKGLTTVIKLIEDVKKAAASGNALGVLSAKTALNNELGCE